MAAKLRYFDGSRSITEVTVLKVSVTRVLKALKSGAYVIQSKKNHYDCLESEKDKRAGNKLRADRYGQPGRLSGSL
jgi:hypothetical protein